MSRQDPDKVFKQEWHDLCNDLHLLKAVVQAYCQLDHDRPGGIKAGCETLVILRPLFRRHGQPRILHHWSVATGREPEMCAHSEDMMVYTWVSWRKALPQIRERVLRHFGMPLDGLIDDADQPELFSS